MKVNTFLFPSLLVVVLALAIGCGDNQISISVQTKQPAVSVKVDGQPIQVKVNNKLQATTGANVSCLIEIQRPKDKKEVSILFEKGGYKPKNVPLSLTNEKKYSLAPVELEELIRKLTVRAFKVFEQSSERVGIAGVNLRISYDGRETLPQQTGLTGSVTLDLPSEAKGAVLTVEHREPGWVISDQDKRQQMGLDSGKEESIVEFLFQEVRERTIAVTCLDSIERRSIQGVSIRWAGETRSSVISDNSGQASISVNSPAGESIRLDLSHPAFFSQSETVTIQKGMDEYPTPVTLDPKLYVSGRVVNAAGGSVSGVTVSAGGLSLGTSDERGNLQQKETRQFSTNARIQVAPPHVLVESQSSITRGDARHYLVSVAFQTNPWEMKLKIVDPANQPVRGVLGYVKKEGDPRLTPAGTTGADGQISARVSDLADTIEVRKDGYRPATVSATLSAQRTPQTVVLEKVTKIKVFLLMKNQAGDAIESANVSVGNNPPLPLREFQGKEYDLGSYQVQISPSDLEYRTWKGPMMVEDDDGDGVFRFPVTLSEDLITKAENAERVGDYQSAAAFYAQVSPEDPEHVRAWFKAGQSYGDQLKDYRQAIGMCDRILEKDKTYAPAYYNKGYYHYLAKEYSAAVKAFEDVVTYQRNLGDQYEPLMYWTRYYLAVASYSYSKEKGIAPAQVQAYRDKAKRYGQDFRDNVPTSYQNTEEHQRLMRRIDQMAADVNK